MTGALLLAAALFFAPEPRGGPIFDGAGVLAPAFETEIAARLEALDQEGGHQIAIVTVAELGGRDPAHFAREAAESMASPELGRAEGILILIVMRERVTRIFVGGMQAAAVPSDAAARILRRKVGPALTRGDPAGAIRAALDEIEPRLRAQ